MAEQSILSLRNGTGARPNSTSVIGYVFCVLTTKEGERQEDTGEKTEKVYEIKRAQSVVSHNKEW